MKNQNVKVFASLFIVLILSQCSKDSLNRESIIKTTLSTNSPDLKVRLTAIKNSFYQQRLDEKIKPKKSDRLLWYPDWENPKIQVVNDSVSYVFYEFLGKLDGKNVNVKTTNGKLFLLVKNEKDFYKAFYYNDNNAQSDKEVKEFKMDKFTGNLLLYSLQNGRNYLLDYYNGHLSASYLKKGALAVKKMQANKGNISYWQESCQTMVKNCTFSTLSTTTCGGSVEVTFDENCNWPPPLCGYPFSLTDSEEVLVCENIWFPDPPDEVGGGGLPVGPPAIEIKMDSLQKYYPCMVKEVLNKLQANATYGKLIQPFQSIRLPNGSMLNSLQGLPNLTFGFSNQPYGGASNDYMLGNTVSSGRSSQIDFNTSAMSNSSQLFLQMATIHEAGHAYANYYVKQGNYGYPIDTTKYSTWAMNIVNFGAVASSRYINGNFTDHSLFLENYVDNFIQILKDINGNAYTDKEYQMAALFGLNNPGSTPPNSIFNGINLYNIYKGMLEKSYNNLMAKYGITAGEINAFYLDNLINVPANKKLPTNCP